jgi:hypothetical protein
MNHPGQDQPGVVRDLQCKKFWADFNAACEALKADLVASADLWREDAAWEETLADGLEQEPRSHEHPERIIHNP